MSVDDALTQNLSDEDLVKKAAKASAAIYIAVDKTVADDISGILRELIVRWQASRRTPSARDDALEKAALRVGHFLEGVRGQRKGFLLEGGTDEVQIAMYDGAIEMLEKASKSIRSLKDTKHE